MVDILGCRGSMPTPGIEFVRYGGETSCVALSTNQGPPRLLLDAGTGLRNLADLLECCWVEAAEAARARAWLAWVVVREIGDRAAGVGHPIPEGSASFVGDFPGYETWPTCSVMNPFRARSCSATSTGTTPTDFPSPAPSIETMPESTSTYPLKTLTPRSC